jgi:hypothetical protein
MILVFLIGFGLGFSVFYIRSNPERLQKFKDLLK